MRSRFALGGLCLAVAVGVAVLWNAAYPFVPGRYWGTGADPVAQLARLRADPLEALRVIAATVRDWAVMWWRDGYGRYGGHPPPWHGFASDRWVLSIFWVLLVLALCDGPRRRLRGCLSCFGAGLRIAGPDRLLGRLYAGGIGHRGRHPGPLFPAHARVGAARAGCRCRRLAPGQAAPRPASCPLPDRPGAERGRARGDLERLEGAVAHWWLSAG